MTGVQTCALPICFDFWAFGDLDLVYGDLREVYTERLLSKYDLISNHETRVSGHLCLIRNTKLMREIFKKVPDWKVKIINKEHLAFDEKAFSKLFVKHKNFPNWLRKFTNKIYPLVLTLSKYSMVKILRHGHDTKHL